MLRRRLLFRLGVLVVGFVSGAVVAIILLQSLLSDLDRMTADAAAMIDGVQDLSHEIAAYESDLAAAGQSPEARVAAATAHSRPINEVLVRLGAHRVMRPGGAGAEAFARISQAVPAAAGTHQPQSAVSLWRDVTELGKIARRDIASQQAALSSNLRILLIALTIGALIMVNISVVVLLQTGQMILRPVGALVEGSRLLARERFEHRVHVDQDDEFGELAHAYNRLAEQLQANERRRIEILRQLAVSLNHELNNVIGIIDLQLSLLDRRAVGDPALRSHLRQIHENLRRMADTVSSLKDLKRIVLTDYVPGQKMLDLPRCTEPVMPPASPQPVPAATAKPS
jgi:signal transduction histidine kinase